MTISFRKISACALVALALGVAPSTAAPIQLISNGDFETGTFAGWTVTNAGSGDWFVDTPGTTVPVSGQPTDATGGGPHGSFYAVTGQGGGGAHALFQSFVVAAGATEVILEFDMFANNWAASTIVGANLDHTSGPNQHARVELFGAGNPGLGMAGVLATFFTGADAGANPNPFTHYTIDITGLVAGGGTFGLRFAEVDNQLFFSQGVDNVSVLASEVPEPSTWALVGFGAAAIAARRFRRRQ